MTVAIEQGKDQIAQLVQHFLANRESYHAPGYKEAHARQEFIDPFFMALGWDIRNERRAAPQYREVVTEDSLEIEGHRKAPDYVFRVGQTPKFFAEAKKPGVTIKNDPAPAYQLRRYAWSAKLPLSLLTDFDELAVYDCRSRPRDTDKPSTARIHYITCAEYADRWQELWDLFSRDAVWAGSFDRFAQADKGKRGTGEVDAEFLKEIEVWRDVLARNIALRNPRLETDDLNDAVQRTIDRVIFLRMAEDRGMEPYEQLRRLAESEDIYKKFMRGLCRRADEKYNSGLFDFAKDKLTPTVVVDDKVLKPIIEGLYFPACPYEFSVLPAEILGNVYEQFLGKVIRLTAGHQAKVEEKPEVRKAGGVYYTPAYIVEYIVKNTVGKMIEGKGPKPLEGFRVLDMACGSGSFLLGAYQHLLDHYLAWYIVHNPEKHPKAVWQHRGEWRLTVAEKKRILLEHVYGVDIDRQAVEVSKLSLLLKVLEGENDETLSEQRRQLTFWRDRALPDLDSNIKCGNSLIGRDYFSGLLPDRDAMRLIKPFDWNTQFPEAMQAGGFDCVIGNPPYVRQEGLQDLKPYFQKEYKTYLPTADLYVNFIEKAHRILKPSGLFGMIVSNKWLRASYGKPLREYLAKNVSILQIVDLAGLPVFAGATVRTVILISSPQSNPGVAFHYLSPPRLDEFRTVHSGDNLAKLFAAGSVALSVSNLLPAGWALAQADAQQVLQRVSQDCVPLLEYAGGKMFRGVVTGMNEVFVIDATTRERLIAADRRNREIIRRVLAGRDIRRYCIDYQDKYLIFTRRGIEINRYPSVLKYLEEYRRDLTPKKSREEDHGRKPGNYKWYEIQDTIDYHSEFERPKIIYPDISVSCRFVLDTDGFLGTNTTYFIPKLDLYLLGILNSNFAQTYFSAACAGLEGRGTTYLRFFGQYMENFPIRPSNLSDPSDKARHDRMVSLVGQMLELHKRLHDAKSSAADRDLYQQQIASTDREIDHLVYELYGLTDEEIRIVEHGMDRAKESG